MKMLVVRLFSLALGGISILPAIAVADRVQNQQPKAHWYRTYDQGTPALSSTITERHIRNGYEVLDRNMQTIRRVPPYIASQYDQQKAQRDRLDAQRQADRNLMAIHISSLHAATKLRSACRCASSRSRWAFCWSYCEAIYGGTRRSICMFLSSTS